MKTELTTRLERVKAECRKAIELKHDADECYVAFDSLSDAEVYQHSRTFAPSAARALLAAIEGLEEIVSLTPGNMHWQADKALTEICTTFEHEHTA